MSNKTPNFGLFLSGYNDQEHRQLDANLYVLDTVLQQYANSLSSGNDSQASSPGSIGSDTIDGGTF